MSHWDRLYKAGRTGFTKEKILVDQELQPKLKLLYEYGKREPTNSVIEKANRTYIFNTWRTQTFKLKGNRFTVKSLVPEMKDILDDLDAGREMCCTAMRKAGFDGGGAVARIDSAVDALNLGGALNFREETADQMADVIQVMRKGLAWLASTEDRQWTLDESKFGRTSERGGSRFVFQGLTFVESAKMARALVDSRKTRKLENPLNAHLVATAPTDSRKRAREVGEAEDQDGDVTMGDSNKRLRLDDGQVHEMLALPGVEVEATDSDVTVQVGEIDDEFLDKLASLCQDPWLSMTAASIANFIGEEAFRKVKGAVQAGMKKSPAWAFALQADGTEAGRDASSKLECFDRWISRPDKHVAAETGTSTPEWAPLFGNVDLARSRWIESPFESRSELVVKGMRSVSSTEVYYLRVTEEVAMAIERAYDAGRRAQEAALQERQTTRTSSSAAMPSVTGDPDSAPERFKRPEGRDEEGNIDRRQIPTAVAYDVDWVLEDWMTKQQAGRRLDDGMLFGGKLSSGSEGLSRKDDIAEAAELFKKLLHAFAHYLDDVAANNEMERLALDVLRKGLGAVVKAGWDDPIWRA
ncbi:hypothetical protein FRB90_008108, partial [Tulasnella sp. 427]